MIWDQKATAEDDVLQLLGELGVRMVTQLISNVHYTGQWPRDFTEFTMTCLKEEANSYKIQRPSHNQQR